MIGNRATQLRSLLGELTQDDLLSHDVAPVELDWAQPTMFGILRALGEFSLTLTFLLLLLQNILSNNSLVRWSLLIAILLSCCKIPLFLLRAFNKNDLMYHMKKENDVGSPAVLLHISGPCWLVACRDWGLSTLGDLGSFLIIMSLFTPTLAELIILCSPIYGFTNPAQTENAHAKHIESDYVSLSPRLIDW